MIRLGCGAWALGETVWSALAPCAGAVMHYAPFNVAIGTECTRA